MKNTLIRRTVAVMMLLVMFCSVMPLHSMVLTASAEAPEPAAEAATEEAPTEETSTAEPEDPSEQDDAPENLTVVKEPDASAATEPTEAPASVEPPAAENSAPSEADPQSLTEAEPTTAAEPAAAPETPEAEAPLETVSGTGTMNLIYRFQISPGFEFVGAAALLTHSSTKRIVSNDNAYVAYCLQPRKNADAGVEYVEIVEDAVSYWETIPETAKRAITLALTYADGVLAEKNRQLTHYDELVLQIVVWEFLTGHRFNTPPYAVNRGTPSTNETEVIAYVTSHISQLEKLQPDGAWTIVSQDNTLLQNAKDLYQEVLKRMAKNGLIPSFASEYQATAPTFLMQYDPARGVYTYTTSPDSNHILSDFTWSASDVTFTKNADDSLTIETANPNAVSGKLFKANGQSFVVEGETNVLAYMPKQAGSDYQECVTYVGQRPDPVSAYFRLEVPASSMKMKKLVSGEGSKAGFRLRMFNADVGKTVYGESDENGDLFVTNNKYTPLTDADGNKLYTFSDMKPGAYRFVEQYVEGYVPESFRVSIQRPDGNVTQLAFFTQAEILAESAGFDGSDYYMPLVSVETLPGGSTLLVEVKNAPKPGTMKMLKTSSNNEVEGYCFKLYRHSDSFAGQKTWYGKSDSSGNVYITDSSYTASGEQIYTFKDLYDGMYAFKEVLSASGRDNVWPESIEIVTSGGMTPACHYIFPDPERGYSLIRTSEGDCALPITGLNGGGTLTIKVHNKVEELHGSLKLLKLDKTTRTPLKDAGFRLFDAEGTQIAEGFTDENGELIFSDLQEGSYFYQEFQAPDGYTLDETLYPFSVTDTNPDITIERENDIFEGSIRVRKLNERGQPMAGVAYLLEYSLDDGASWFPIGYRDSADPVKVGCSTNDEAVDGVALTGTDGWVEFAGLAVNNQLCNIRYRMTEVKTWVGYELLSAPVFDGYLTADQSEMEYAAVNHPSFQLPMTGGSGFTSVGLALGFSVLAASILLLMLPKKRENEE